MWAKTKEGTTLIYALGEAAIDAKEKNKAIGIGSATRSAFLRSKNTLANFMKVKNFDLKSGVFVNEEIVLVLGFTY